jgi:hypothetical protein
MKIALICSRKTGNSIKLQCNRRMNKFWTKLFLFLFFYKFDQ